MFEKQAVRFQRHSFYSVGVFQGLETESGESPRTKCMLDGNLAVISKSHFHFLSSPPQPNQVQTAAAATSGHQRKSNMILTAAPGSSETVGPQRWQGCTPRCCRGPPTDEWRDETTTEMEMGKSMTEVGGGQTSESWRRRVRATWDVRENSSWCVRNSPTGAAASQRWRGWVGDGGGAGGLNRVSSEALWVEILAGDADDAGGGRRGW